MGKNVTTTPQTPGAMAPVPPAETAGDAGEPEVQGVEQPELPPDLQQLVAQEVAKGVAAEMAKRAPAPAPAKPAPPAVLPRYEDVEREQLAREPDKRQSVLTDKGWFVAEKPLPPNVNKLSI